MSDTLKIGHVIDQPQERAVAARDAEIERLRARVAELENRVEELKARAFSAALKGAKPFIEQRDRLETALSFYARHEHWMGLTDNSPDTVLIAIGPTSNPNGWAEAEVALAALAKAPTNAR